MSNSKSRRLERKAGGWMVYDQRDADKGFSFNRLSLLSSWTGAPFPRADSVPEEVFSLNDLEKLEEKFGSKRNQSRK